MLFETWADVLAASFQNLSVGVIAFIPHIVIAILIMVVGWLVGAGFGRLVGRLVSTLKVDNALRSAGVEDVLARGGFPLNTGAFLGALVKWFILAVFLVAALDVLNLTQVNVFLQEVVLAYLPNVFVAVLILLLAALIAELVYNVVSGATKAAEIPSSLFLAKVAKWAIWIFALLAALNQLGVASTFVQTLFTGVVVAVSLAVGLAFGLGGKDAAARYLERLERDMAERHKK